jgi:hypothetical protein
MFHGCVRESLAAANSVARIGTQDTRAWERPLRYVADDNQGNVGVVEFRGEGAIAAISARAPTGPLVPERGFELSPFGPSDALSRLAELPLLREGSGVSSVFWTVGPTIVGPEGYEGIGKCAAELFRRELLSDADWQQEAIAHYDLTAEVARLACAVAGRAVVGAPILELREAELRVLLPQGSDHQGEAFELLTSDGLFAIHHGGDE